MKVSLLEARVETRPRENTDCLFETQSFGIMGYGYTMKVCIKCGAKNTSDKIRKCPSNLTDDEAIIRDVLK